MSKKSLGMVLIFIGAVAAIVSLGADALGLGNGLGIGWKQIVGALVGVLILAVGAWFSRAKTS